MEATFIINDKVHKISPATVPIDTSLNEYIRKYAKLSGTKFMCLEGGCGTCIVSVKGVHPINRVQSTWAINSCLQNIYSCHGLTITTVEGLGSKKFGMHQIQSRLANFNGTQCGFCSSGMVMNMHSLMEANGGKVTMEQVENSFGGNICRCTGYRPILDAFKSLTVNADESLKEKCNDIEDLGKTCPKTGTPCSGSCRSGKEEVLHFKFSDDREWHKVKTIKEIFDIWNSIGDKPYMLVGGNTAHGVYRRPRDLKVFIDINSVDTLRDHNIDTKLKLGGGVNLTETMELFRKTADANNNFSYLREMVKHIDLVAHVPVRNAGTLAGNLMIKNQHREFPSDIFLLLEGVGAELNIANTESTTVQKSPSNFLDLDMRKKIIVSIVLPKLDPNKFIFRSYKIMPRAQNAHAIINATFLIEANSDGQVSSARICFGGINPQFIHASNTEKYLVGKNLYTNDTLQGALNSLSGEINPDWVLPDPSPDYRKHLALSLFYKFVLKTAPEGKVVKKFKSGGDLLSRGISSGKQTFDTIEKNWPLTKNIPKIEADVQCTGEAKYVNDIPNLPDELYAAFVLAKLVHRKIKSFNTDQALKMPGVVAFFSAKDIPGLNNFMPVGNVDVEEILCSSDVKFFGQPAGIIVADNMDLAIYAAGLVEVLYETGESSNPILPTIKEVYDAQADSRIKSPNKSKKKKVSTMISSLIDKCTQDDVNATQIIKGHFELGGQYHFTMETLSTVVIPIEDGLDVFAATQWIDLTQIAIAFSLKIPSNLVNMNVRRLGGGYGAKISRCNQIACAAALAAFKLNKPVRFVMNIESNMTSIGKRHSVVADYEVTVNDEGVIEKMKNDFIEDYGCSLNERVIDGSTEFFKNCYNSRGWEITAKEALTDSPSNTWCRAPGTVEGIAMIENIMDHIAYSVGKDPLQVRLSNIPKNSKIRSLLTEIVTTSEYDKRKEEIDEFNNTNRWTKRGIAVIPLKYHLGYFGSQNALVSVYYADGTVSISHGGIEMGQGLNTKTAQTAAYILGIPLDKISIKPTNNFTAPNAIVTGGSQGSDISCFAVQKACEIIKTRLEPVRKANPNDDWTKIVQKAYSQNIDLMASYFFKATDLKEYDIWGAACTEIEVDLLTGNLLLKRVDILEDLGESMSPGVDVGQIEGAFVMGLGYCLTEELVYNKQTGELLTNRTWNYKPPGAKDIPIDFRIKFLQNSSNPFGVLRSKAVGEPATCMAFSAIMALRHALNSARKDAGIVGNEFYHLSAPTTTETIFLAANNKPDQFLIS